MAFWIALAVSAAVAVIIPAWVAIARGGRWRAYRTHGTWYGHDHPNAWVYGWWALLPMAMFMFVGGIVATSARTDVHDYNQVSTVDLQALKSPTTYDGNFFLFGGTVDEEMVYRYLVKDEEGIITRHEVDADRSYIIEGGDGAKLEYRWQCNTWTFPWGACRMPAYVFYVPTGSVLNQYEVTP